ncbi:MAG: glycosyltransferase family 2 protein [archaeon]
MTDIKRLNFFDRSVLFLLLALFVSIVMVVSFFFPTIYVWIVLNALVLFGVLIYLVIFLGNKSAGRAVAPKSFPSISIIVPCFNSKGTIRACIDSIKKLKYPKKFEIIVVDDCSTDGSRELLEKISGITLIKLKKNSGNSVARNTGLARAKSEFVVYIDSDSYPEEDLFYKTLGYFEDKSVGAVTCLILPDKNKTVIQKIQYFEYLSSFGMNNSLLSSINSSYVVPGPMTIFRKSVFSKVGEFTPGILAEDMDWGLRLKKHGLKIMSCVDAVVLTDVPSTWRGLFKQRDRWYRGGTYNFITHKSLMFNKTNKDFGFFVMPFLFFTQILTIALIMRIILYFFVDLYNFVSIYANFLLLGGKISLDFSGLVIPPSLTFFALTYCIIALYFFISFWFAQRGPFLRDLPALVMLIFIYPYFVTFTYSQSYFKEMFGVRARWLRVST